MPKKIKFLFESSKSVLTNVTMQLVIAQETCNGTAIAIYLFDVKITLENIMFAEFWIPIVPLNLKKLSTI